MPWLSTYKNYLSDSCLRISIRIIKKVLIVRLKLITGYWIYVYYDTSCISHRKVEVELIDRPQMNYELLDKRILNKVQPELTIRDWLYKQSKPK